LKRGRMFSDPIRLAGSDRLASPVFSSTVIQVTDH